MILGCPPGVTLTGYSYALQWMVTLPLEIVAASITLQFWQGAQDTNPSAWVTIFLFVIIAINFFGVKGYGEAEFVFSIIKILAVIGFIILGIIINCGGGPNGHYYGTHYWYDPGAFNNGFKGLCSVFTTAAFSFSGTELVGLAAAETENPRKTLPKAVKQVFWRICLVSTQSLHERTYPDMLQFYMVSLTIVGTLVPYDDDSLLGASSSDANASPFVIAVRNAGISAVPSIMNVVILIAVLSVGNSSIYGSSRTLAALADRGQAPKLLGYIDRSGRPLVAIIFSSAFGFLSYVVAAGPDAQEQAFSWMIALSGLSSIFTWGSICLVRVIVFLACLMAADHCSATSVSEKPGSSLVTPLMSSPSSRKLPFGVLGRDSYLTAWSSSCHSGPVLLRLVMLT